MNTLVVYDSQYGNTERIAQAIADTLREFGQVKAVRVDPAHPVELQGVNLLIVGCPTQGFRPTPAMQSFSTKHLNRISPRSNRSRETQADTDRIP